jgi:predicted Zn-dependent protease
LFSAVEELGDDLKFLSRIGAPSLLVKEIIITGF